MRSRFTLCALAFLAAVLAGGGSASAGSPPAQAPQLALRAATGSVTLYTYGRKPQPVYLDLGVYLQASGGDLRMNVSRRYGHPIRVVQRIGTAGRVLPSRVADSWNGLARFLVFDVRTADGALVMHRAVTWCPNQYDEQRVDPDSAANPTFPATCGYNPFTVGAIWGLDQGWADPVVDSAPYPSLAPGRYRITVSVAPVYRSMFNIAPGDAQVTVSATVKRQSGGGCPPICGAAARRRLTQAGAAQRVNPVTPSSSTPPTTTSPDPATVPDLVALPAWQINVSRHGRRDYIDFGATVWDKGPAPMVVEGFRRPGTDVMDAWEYFYRDGQVVGRAPAGTLMYDAQPGHEHWHFEQFARYALVAADRTTVVRSHKDGFCLAPTDAIDMLVPNALYNPDSTGFFGQCGTQTSIWTRETLPVGWGDTYFQGLPGQSLDITGVPNGTYYVEVQANPLGDLHEVTVANDTSLRKIVLGGRPGARSVRVAPWKGITA